MIKKKLQFDSKYLMKGKDSKYLWKALHKKKNKEDLSQAILYLAYQVQELDERLVELKKFVGDKYEY